MATRFINLDMLPGIELKNVVDSGEVLMKDDIFDRSDELYIVSRMDESKYGYKFGCVAKTKVKKVVKVPDEGRVRLVLDSIKLCEPFNMGGIKALGENYWYQKFLRMPAKVDNVDIVDWMSSEFKEAGKSSEGVLNMSEVKADTNVKKEEVASGSEPKKVATARKSRAKKSTVAKKAPVAKKKVAGKSEDSTTKEEVNVAKKPVRKSRAKTSVVADKKQEELKLDTASDTAKNTSKDTAKDTVAKPKRTRSRKATAEKSAAKTTRAGRTGGTGRSTKRTAVEGKVTDLSTRRARKTVAEKAEQAKKVSAEISRRAGRVGAVGNRAGGTATLEKPKATDAKGSVTADTKAAKKVSTDQKSTRGRASGTRVTDAVNKAKSDVSAVTGSVPVVDTVSALTESTDPGSRVTIDVKNNKLEISMNFVMDRSSFVESELSQLNFFMEQVVSNVFKMKAVYEWTSEEEKQYIVENWIESIMADLRSDEAKAKRLMDYVKKSKKVADWEVGLVMREMISDSLKNNENVHFVYEVRGLTDKQKVALENLVKANKLEIDLSIA